MEVCKISERDNYHTYWTLHIPRLLNTIEKWVRTENINISNTSTVGQIIKNAYKRVARVAPNVASQRASPCACSVESYKQ